MLGQRQEDKLVLSLIIKVKLSQFPASDEDENNPAISKKDLMVTKMMNIQSKVLNLSSAEFKTLTGTDDQNKEFCKKMVKHLSSALKASHEHEQTLNAKNRISSINDFKSEFEIEDY